MHELITVPVENLLLDRRNVRLSAEPADQFGAVSSLADKEGGRLVNLAEDIVENGLDPTALPAVVPTDDQQERYWVLEGNRRIGALKILHTPSLIKGAVKDTQYNKYQKFSEVFQDDPIEEVECVVFETEKEVVHWIELRHTGQNQGKGLVEWGSNEKDRFADRYGDERSPAGQIIDFVEEYGDLSEEATESDKGIITSVRRLIGTPKVRETLGIDREKGVVYAHYPRSEVAKSLSYIVEQLKTGETKVKDIYYSDDRKQYAEQIPESCIPDSDVQLEERVPLEVVTDEGMSADEERSNGRRGDEEEQGDEGRDRGSLNGDDSDASASERTRASVVPRDSRIEVDHPRMKRIYNELRGLNAEKYPNACSVLTRVFVELSVDHFLSVQSLMDEDGRRSQPLAKRMKVAATFLEDAGIVESQVVRAVSRAADSGYYLAAATVTWNQYVHNKFVYPKSTELKDAWDELEPFVEALWEEV